jgi:hypothetical protein
MFATLRFKPDRGAILCDRLPDTKRPFPPLPSAGKCSRNSRASGEKIVQDSLVPIELGCDIRGRKLQIYSRQKLLNRLSASDGIDRGRGDRAVAKPALSRAVPWPLLVREDITAAVSKHVRMDLDTEPRRGGCPLERDTGRPTHMIRS